MYALLLVWLKTKTMKMIRPAPPLLTNQTPPAPLPLKLITIKMEKLSAGDGKKNPKQHSDKAKMKKPVKVVYISNPMKVKATPAEFRALVQELTGRDSTVPDLSPFPEPGGRRDIPPQAGTAFGNNTVPGSSYAGGNPDLSSVPCDSRGYGLRDPDKV